MAKKTPLDLYDYELTPPAMKAYLRNYGFSFSKKACEYAVKQMKKKNSATGKMERIEMWDKDKVEEMFKKHNITLDNNMGYNHIYLFNYAMADYYKSSLPDEKFVCLWVKDVIDDVDGEPENIFRKWVISMVGKGEPIEWEELL